MANKEFFSYKGKPLVRCGDELYYGSMADSFVIRMQIKTKKEVNGLQVADKVAVQLMCTDPDLSPRKQLVKASEKIYGFTEKRRRASYKSVFIRWKLDAFTVADF